MEKEKESDFGKGFVYNLILFAKHWAQARTDIERFEKAFKGTYSKKDNQKKALATWCNAASDHFIELKIPRQFKEKEIGQLAKWLQDKCLYWGHAFEKEPTEKDFNQVFNKLEKLAILIDKELKVKDIKAKWN